MLITPVSYMQGIVVKLFKHEKSEGGTAVYHASGAELRAVDLHPSWRDGAPDSGGLNEYFIRLARSMGVHASETGLMGDGLRFRRSTGVIDEATITWPGKTN